MQKLSFPQYSQLLTVHLMVGISIPNRSSMLDAFPHQQRKPVVICCCCMKCAVFSINGL